MFTEIQKTRPSGTRSTTTDLFLFRGITTVKFCLSFLDEDLSFIVPVWLFEAPFHGDESSTI